MTAAPSAANSHDAFAQLLGGDFGDDVRVDRDVATFYAGAARALGVQPPDTGCGAGIPDSLLRRRIDQVLAGDLSPTDEAQASAGPSDSTSVTGKRVELLDHEIPVVDPTALSRDRGMFYRHIEKVICQTAGVEVADLSSSRGLAEQSLRRAAIDCAFRDLTRVGDGAAEAGKALQAAAQMLLGTPQASEPLAIEGYLVATGWRESSAGAFLLSAVRDDLAPQTFTYVEPGPAVISKLRAGIELLLEHTGDLGRGVMGTVNGALLIESDAVESAFIVPMPTVSVLNVAVFGDVVDAADAVFHEACHQKFYDLIVVRRLLRGGYRYFEGPLFDIPWTPVGGRKRQMDALRILSTLHVYAHLTCMLASMLQSPQPRVRETARSKAQDYWERAQYFRRLARRSTELRESLGPDGSSFIDWLLHAMTMTERAFMRENIVAAGHFVRDADEAVARAAAS